MLKRFLIPILCVCLLPLPQLHAAEGFLSLPAPGTMVHLSPSFNPPLLKGIKVHLDDPFKFDFIINNTVETRFIASDTTKLIKYFLAALTTPEQDMWVNLSPYEKDRIVPDGFGQTEMGRDLLAQDYILKQITASLIYPEDAIGKEFWKRIYEATANKNIPVNTFNKVWIVPNKAVVYENVKAGTAYVVESSLKVLTEQDYSANQKNNSQDNNNLIVKDVVIPQLTKEVNEGANFAQLRQVYNALILATWYKKKIKDSILSKVYTDQNKINGVNINDPLEKERIYARYLEAFKKGAFNYIKDSGLPNGTTAPRKYFAGGFNFAMTSHMDYVTSIPDKSLTGDTAIVRIELNAFNDQAMTVESDHWYFEMIAHKEYRIVKKRWLNAEIIRGLNDQRLKKYLDEISQAGFDSVENLARFSFGTSTTHDIYKDLMYVQNSIRTWVFDYLEDIEFARNHQRKDRLTELINVLKLFSKDPKLISHRIKNVGLKEAEYLKRLMLVLMHSDQTGALSFRFDGNDVLIDVINRSGLLETIDYLRNVQQGFYQVDQYLENEDLIERLIHYYEDLLQTNPYGVYEDLIDEDVFVNTPFLALGVLYKLWQEGDLKVKGNIASILNRAVLENESLQASYDRFADLLPEDAVMKVILHGPNDSGNVLPLKDADKDEAMTSRRSLLLGAGFLTLAGAGSVLTLNQTLNRPYMEWVDPTTSQRFGFAGFTYPQARLINVIKGIFDNQGNLSAWGKADEVYVREILKDLVVNDNFQQFAKDYYDALMRAETAFNQKPFDVIAVEGQLPDPRWDGKSVIVDYGAYNRIIDVMHKTIASLFENQTEQLDLKQLSDVVDALVIPPHVLIARRNAAFAKVKMTYIEKHVLYHDNVRDNFVAQTYLDRGLDDAYKGQMELAKKSASARSAYMAEIGKSQQNILFLTSTVHQNDIYAILSQNQAMITRRQVLNFGVIAAGSVGLAHLEIIKVEEKEAVKPKMPKVTIMGIAHPPEDLTAYMFKKLIDKDILSLSDFEIVRIARLLKQFIDSNQRMLAQYETTIDKFSAFMARHEVRVVGVEGAVMSQHTKQGEVISINPNTIELYKKKVERAAKTLWSRDEAKKYLPELMKVCLPMAHYLSVKYPKPQEIRILPLENGVILQDAYIRNKQMLEARAFLRDRLFDADQLNDLNKRRLANAVEQLDLSAVKELEDYFNTIKKISVEHRTAINQGVQRLKDAVKAMVDINKKRQQHWADQITGINQKEITGINKNEIAVIASSAWTKDLENVLHAKADAEKQKIETQVELIDQAMTATGGIDFNADKIDFDIKNSGEDIKFNVDPTTLERWNNVTGFVPVIINVKPLPQGAAGVLDLKAFLGITS